MDGSLPGTIPSSRLRNVSFKLCLLVLFGSRTLLPPSFYLSFFLSLSFSRCILSHLSPCSLDLRSRLPSSAVPTRKFNTGPSWRGTGCVRSPRIRESETEIIRFRRRAFEPPLGRHRSRQADRSIVSRTTRILRWILSKSASPRLAFFYLSSSSEVAKVGPARGLSPHSLFRSNLHDLTFFFFS